MKLVSFRFPALLATAITIMPYAVFAQTTVDALLLRINTTANTIIGILFIIATVVFLWGVVKFIASAGNETERKNAKSIMTWGIIGLAVMAAAWGITTVLIEYFNIPALGPTFRQYPTGPRPF